MADIPYYKTIDDCPHAPGKEANWQESALFTWYDRDAGVGGFWRLGQEPVNGATNSCFGIFTRAGVRFRSNVTGVPLGESDRGETHLGLGSQLRAEMDSGPRILADFPNCEADLRFEDFHPRYIYHELVGAKFNQDSTAHHFEVAGAVTGKVRLGEQTLRVNALGYRDRSWGLRTWGTLRSTRWWPCVFGPDLSLHTIQCVIDSGDMLGLGYVLRDGKPQVIVDADVVVEIESDAMSPRRGYGTLHLDNGETLEIACTAVDGIVLHVRGYTAVESIGEVRLGDRVGICDLEVCTNPTGGSKPPVFGLTSNIGDDLSRR